MAQDQYAGLAGSKRDQLRIKKGIVGATVGSAPPGRRPAIRLEPNRKDIVVAAFINSSDPLESHCQPQKKGPTRL